MITSLPILDEAPFHARFETGLRAAETIRTLQINIGYVCNLACHHCHVESSPARTGPGENMDEPTSHRVVEWVLANDSIGTVDFTGGSPEMNPNFRWMVERLRAGGRHVMDRCNPTIVSYVDRHDGATYDWVPKFLADNRVEIVASMPCYLSENVESQRGRGSFDTSIEGLRRLNDVGYGRDDALRLNLVYNPVGPHLPPAQKSLEADYKRVLESEFGLVFNELWTITNMPIKRWRRQLEREGELERYMMLLIEAHNPETIEGLMCRHQVSIDPQGRLYDCDFNQAIGIPMPAREGNLLWELSADALTRRTIGTGDHCYGCTAGSGSSCGGSLVV